MEAIKVTYQSPTLEAADVICGKSLHMREVRRGVSWRSRTLKTGRQTDGSDPT